MIGRFISFEGEEGCGKTTHINLLAQKLRGSGIDVIVTREPGGTPLCESIRSLLMFDSATESPTPTAETLLFCASRAQLVEKVIRPALNRGSWVLSDRFADSTLAYQGYGRGFDLPTLRSLLAFATNGLSPDLTFLLEISPAIEAERLAKRYASGQAIDRFEQEKSSFHTRVTNGFQTIAAEEPSRIHRLSTDAPLESTAEKIWQMISPLLPQSTFPSP